MSDNASDMNYMRSPLPTRVSSACERCRRHKTRCDPFRPCSLCVRAQVNCRQTPINRARKDSTRRSRTVRNRRSQTTPSTVPAGSSPGESNREVIQDPEKASRNDNPSEVATPRSMGYGEAESTMGIAHRIVGLGRQHIDEQSTSAIPGYQASTAIIDRPTAARGRRVPISSILGKALPPTDMLHSLLEDYFDAVHWFSLVIYEPNFRKGLDSVIDGLAYPSQKPFLILLFVVLGMGAWYRSQKQSINPSDTHDWREMSDELLQVVELSIVEVMDQPSVTSAQICILFGSYCVYHGRPNLSFSLLGATIRISQAAGLYREPSRGSFEDKEERKRVWWTIYTWDRFASITYGRPLGINDRDCNISMPANVLENPHFASPVAGQGYKVCYSTYQRELNRLYLTASTALEAIFGSRTSGSSKDLAGDTYLALVKEATQNLETWRAELPVHLTSNFDQDFRPENGLTAKAHALQSLSLQLTYDSILIVLHRPLLARQVDFLSSDLSSTRKRGVGSHSQASDTISPTRGTSPFEALSPNVSEASSVHWWNAALRTSRVTELPVLAQLATDSHLVAFLAINVFNAAIVLAVMALSDPLSDAAQTVKRTITRILRLQDLLGKRSALSKQSTVILKNVVTLLLRRESEAILAPITRDHQDENQQPHASSGPMSVEDTLRLPLDVGFETAERRQHWQDHANIHRLNESLATVQHVVPYGEDNRPYDWHLGQDSNQPFAISQETLPRGHSSAPPGQLDPIGTSIFGDPFQGTTDANGEGGLYWLWDMSWNGGM